MAGTGVILKTYSHVYWLVLVVSWDSQQVLLAEVLVAGRLGSKSEGVSQEKKVGGEKKKENKVKKNKKTPQKLMPSF